MNQVTSQVAGRNPVPSLGCGVWPVSAGGDDNFYAETILPTGLQVTDTAAEAALAQANVNLAQVHVDLAQVHVDLGTTNSDLGAIATNTATLHTDLQGIQTTDSSILTAANAAEASLATVVTNTGATTTAVAAVTSELSGQIHTDLAQVHVDLGTTNSDLGQLHTDIATTVHTDLEQLHTDLGTANSDLATIVANTTVVAPAGHVRCFQVTNNGSVQVIVPASADGRGKTVTNASVQAAANGADQWVGPAGVTAGNGHYLGPGSSMSFSGREAIYVNGVSGLTTALEEYT